MMVSGNSIVIVAMFPSLANTLTGPLLGETATPQVHKR